MTMFRNDRNHRTLRHWLAWVALGLALTTIFWAYTRPGFMVDLVDSLWACF